MLERKYFLYFFLWDLLEVVTNQGNSGKGALYFFKLSFFGVVPETSFLFYRKYDFCPFLIEEGAH